MKAQKRNTICLLCIVCVFISCQFKYHQSENEIHTTLRALDSLILKHPKVAMDRLFRLNTQNFSKANLSYYQLLTVIAASKAYVFSANDSVINLAVEGLSSQNDAYNYARALLYQGIVRYRTKPNDSTSLLPIKQAITHFKSSAHPDLDKLEIAYRFLAKIHQMKQNYPLAYNYFKKSIGYARQQNDTVKLLYSYLNLANNRLQVNDVVNAKRYLDSANSLPAKNVYVAEHKEKLFALYSICCGSYESSLQTLKKLVRQDSGGAYNPQQLLENLYWISNCYRKMHKPDSAILYARKAVELLDDSTKKQNYVYHQNVAEISETLNQPLLSAQAYKQAFKALKQTINQQTDIQLREAEKRYDKTQAENTAQRLIQKNYRMIVVIAYLIILIPASLLLYIVLKIRDKKRILEITEKTLKLQEDKLKTDLELKKSNNNLQAMQEENRRLEKELKLTCQTLETEVDHNDQIKLKLHENIECYKSELLKKNQLECELKESIQKLHHEIEQNEILKHELQLKNQTYQQELIKEQETLIKLSETEQALQDNDLKYQQSLKLQQQLINKLRESNTHYEQELEENEKLQQLLAEKIHAGQLAQQDIDMKKNLIDYFHTATSCYANLYKHILRISQKLVKSNPEIYKDISKHISKNNKDINLISRMLINDDVFKHITGVDRKMHLFSSGERMLLILLACNATNPQIVGILNTNSNNIRVRKCKLRAKLEKYAISINETIKNQLYCAQDVQ